MSVISALKKLFADGDEELTEKERQRRQREAEKQEARQRLRQQSIRISTLDAQISVVTATQRRERRR